MLTSRPSLRQSFAFDQTALALSCHRQEPRCDGDCLALLEGVDLSCIQVMLVDILLTCAIGRSYRTIHSSPTNILRSRSDSTRDMTIRLPGPRKLPLPLLLIGTRTVQHLTIKLRKTTWPIERVGIIQIRRSLNYT